MTRERDILGHIQKHRAGAITAVFTIISLIAYLGILNLHFKFGTLREQAVPMAILYYLIAMLAFVGMVLWSETRGGVKMKWVWITAVLFRLIFFFTTPTLSDDVYRYMWDGYVFTEGYSPYANAIDDPIYDDLDNSARSLANNSSMASPYLQSAQWVFGLTAVILPLKPILLQIVMVAFDLLSAVVLAKLLQLAALPKHRLLLYLWNPLIILEVAHSAHIDAWMILLTLTAVWLTLKLELGDWGSGSNFYSLVPPIFLAFATLTKILPLLLFPILFWRWSWRQRIIYVGTSVGFLIPSAMRAGWGLMGDLDGRGLFGALRIYGQRWEYYNGVFHWGRELLRWGDWFDDPRESVKWMIAVVLLCFMLWLWREAWRKQDDRLATLRLLAVPYIVYVILTPTLHPWYTLILFTLLVFWPPKEGEGLSRWVWLVPWGWLNTAVFFTYLHYLPNLSGQQGWIRNIEWIPMWILLLSIFVYWVIQRNKVDKYADMPIP